MISGVGILYSDPIFLPILSDFWAFCGYKSGYKSKMKMFPEHRFVPDEGYFWIFLR